MLLSGLALASVTFATVAQLAGATCCWGPAGPPDDSDVLVKSRITDVRCKGATTSCGNANDVGGADSTGELQGNATIRIKDHFNAVAAGGTDPATLVDIPFPVSTFCASTSDTGTGSVCSVDTSANAVRPGTVKDNSSRVVVEMSQTLIWGGGSDGLPSTAPNTLFAAQGLFVP